LLVSIVASGRRRHVDAEFRDLVLDGSRVVLDAGSAIAVDYTASQRGVWLLAGQAFFETFRRGSGRSSWRRVASTSRSQARPSTWRHRRAASPRTTSILRP